MPAPQAAAEPVAITAEPAPAMPLVQPEVVVEAPSPFTQALISAYNTNPRLKAQREELKITDEEVATALSGFRPSAFAGYEKGRQRNRSTGNWAYDDTTSKSLTVSQPLFRGGRTVYGYQSAKQEVKAERAELRRLEQEVLFDAIAAYSDVYEKQSVLELNQNNADVLKQQLDASNARFEVGELTRTDVAQSEARYAQALADLRQAEGDLKTAMATFEKVIGYQPTNLLPDSIIPELPATIEVAIALAKQSNPSLEAIKHIKKATNYDVNEQIGVILPEVSLDGTMSRTEGSGFFGTFDNDSVVVNLTVPLYQSGAEYARIRQAKNRHQQSKYLEMDVENEVVELVTRAFEDYRTSLSVINSTAAAVDAADIARAGVREENQFGVRTILDVLDAEQELFRTRVNLVRAQRSKTLQAYRLMASIGKLSAEDLGLPVAIYDEKKHYENIKWLPVGF